MTTAPPTSWVGPNVSPSHAHATTVATTGSRVATIEARVALMCRSDPVSRENVTIVPITTMNVTSAHRGRVLRQVPLERDLLAENVPREVPERLDDGPKERRE